MNEQWGSPQSEAGEEGSAELLMLLEERGVQLAVEQDQLVVRGRRQALDEDLIARLRAHKDGLIAHLRRAAETDGTAPAGFFEDERSRLVDLTDEEIAAVVATVPGGAANVQDVYPLAPLQEGVLFHHLSARDGDPYLLSTVCAFDSRERLDAYLRAYQEVVDRHDILRTGVLWEGVPEPVQVVWRRAELPVEEIVLDPDGGDALARLWERGDPRRARIDIRRAPLLRITVAHDTANARWLMLTLLHHLVGDHTTLQVVEEEIAALAAGRPEQLLPVRPFRDFIAEVRRGPGREEHEKFFTGMLGDIDEPTAPYGLLDTRGEGHGVAEARTLLDPALSARLRERARRLGVSTASLAHLAWAQVLARLTGRQEVVFGTVLFGRMHGATGVTRAVGPFINTLPLRLTVDARPVEEAVAEAHGALAALLGHEHASLVLAQRCSEVPAPAPLFTSLFNYRHSGDVVSPADEPAGITPLRGEERTNYPLTVSVDDIGDGIALSVQAIEPIDPWHVTGYLSTVLENLADALEHRPQCGTDTIDVLPAAERLLLLAGGSGDRLAGSGSGEHTDSHDRTDSNEHTDSRYRTGSRDRTEAGPCLTDLYQAQAARTPDAIAVVHGDQRLTYAELDAQANRLARRLRTLGAGPDRLVAVRTARGIGMVTGLLAVLKAGAAYLPLDPTHPAARLDAILADSGPVALLTDDDTAAVDPPLPTVLLDDAATEAFPAEPLTRAETGLRPDHLAYVIYTSGSTGTPKGVMVEHANVARLFDRHGRAVRLRPGRRVDAVPLLSRSTSRCGSSGARCCTAAGWSSCRTRSARAPEEFYELLCREGVTVLNQTPSRVPAARRRPTRPLARRPAAAPAALCGLRRRGAGPGTLRPVVRATRRTPARGWSTCTASPRPPCT